MRTLSSKPDIISGRWCGQDYAVPTAHETPCVLTTRPVSSRHAMCPHDILSKGQASLSDSKSTGADSSIFFASFTEAQTGTEKVLALSLERWPPPDDLGVTTSSDTQCCEISTVSRCTTVVGFEHQLTQTVSSLPTEHGVQSKVFSKTSYCA